MNIQTDINLNLCNPSPRARPIDQAAVKALARSITDGGLLNAITVRKLDDGYEVIAGLHRVKAFLHLERETIPAVVLDVDDLHAELMLIDENLYRNDLTPAERASARARRKAIYQQLHPETKPGGDRGNQHTGGKLANGQDGQEATPRFDEADSDAAGQSERTIRRDVTRGEALGEDALAKIARTSLDSGAEMDALIKLPEAARQALIERAAGGDEVSAKAEVQNLVAAGIEAASRSDGQADEAVARDADAASGSREASTTEASDEAGMGSERPSPSEADDLVLDVSDIIGGGAAPAAHMAGRVHPTGDLDFSPTPPWATRALIERVLRHAGREGHCKFQTAWEPACGEGHMAEVMREYFRFVAATDIHNHHGYPDHIADFLNGEHKVPAGHFDWIITNPPFGENILKFMNRALDLAGTGVAMFLHLRYLEGIGRYEKVYRDNPPTIVAPFVERVPLLMGSYDPEASTTTAFMWLVWLKGAKPQPTFFIPHGCCLALTKPDDAARFTQHPVQKHDVPPASEAAE